MSETPAVATEILQGNAALTNKLYQILSRKPGNVFFSPLSIHAVLSIVYQGAQDETAKILAKVLQIPDAKATAVGYKSIFDDLKSVEDVVLYMANKIYAREEVEILQGFENVVREYFDSEIEVLDFRKRVEAANKINDWVVEKTHEKIKSIVDEDSIEEDTVLFLLNAIYFKADWDEPFREESTAVSPFYLDDENTVQVQMMSATKRGFYENSDGLNAEIVSLPYKGKKVSMVIILPKERNGIKDLEAKLALTDLSQLTKNLHDTEINVSLPKFLLEATIELEEIIKELGLGMIFDKKKANFRRMIKLESDENVYVDKILQKAFIEVNEKGAEAAAVTVVRKVKVKKCLTIEHIVNFVVDHPAIFMIVQGEAAHKNVLFYGRLFHPKY